jgi:DNA-binding IclR family transcriptional regulator
MSPLQQALAEQTGDTVFLAVRSGFNGVCVDRMEGSFPIRVFVMDVGRPRPLNIGGCNIAMMSTLSDNEIGRICKVNHERVAEAYPNYSDSLLRKKIREVRTNGFLVNEVLDASTARSVAVPIRGSHEAPAIAAISISAVASRLQSARIAEVSTLLLETVKRIEADIATMDN